MATISIFRPNALYGKLSRWHIKVNDKKTERIKTNDTRSINVPGGTHVVQINAGGWGGANSNKLRITVEENQHVDLKIEVNYSFWWGIIPLIVILMRNRIIKLKQA